MNKKIIDTNCILANPFFYREFEDVTILLPICVVEELDNIKTREGSSGFRARQFFRNFRELEEKGSLFEGIELENNVVLKSFDSTEFKSYHTDDQILKIARNLKIEVITNDVSMRLKAQTKGVSATMLTATDMNKLDNQYSGILEKEVSGKLVSKFSADGFIKLKDIDEEEMYPNQFFIGTCNGSYKKILARYCNKSKKLVKLNYEKYAVSGINAMDDKQKFVIEAIMNPDIPFVSITGRQGCGKTFLALASGMDMLDNKKVEKILIGKNTSPIDKYSYQGFTSGDTDEKLVTHFGNYTSTFENIMKKRTKSNKEINGKKILEKMIDKEEVKILDISSILGSSFEDKFVIVDEAQSFDAHAMRSIITRIGEGSKMVLVGDIGQQTVSRLAPDKSGLFAGVEWLKEMEETAHITLEDVHRSKFVEKASRIFDEKMFG